MFTAIHCQGLLLTAEYTTEYCEPDAFAGGLADGSRRISDGFEMDPKQAEWVRHEAVMLNINDPTTPEGAISERALKRLEELVGEMELELGLAHMAHQVWAQIFSSFMLTSHPIKSHVE